MDEITSYSIGLFFFAVLIAISLIIWFVKGCKSMENILTIVERQHAENDREKARVKGGK